MSSREKILQAIATSKPADRPLPILDYSIVNRPADLVASFEQFVQAVGGRVFQLSGANALEEYLKTDNCTNGLCINRVAEMGPVDEVPPSLETLETLQRAYIKGRIGVAENGAVWVDETAMGNRIVPFICQELVLVIKASDIVSSMHDAYQLIQVNETGYGAFIAGPSKTADIEQSLVIGAHGPVALTVLILQ